jgi:hypothetical protein
MTMTTSVLRMFANEQSPQGINQQYSSNKDDRSDSCPMFADERMSEGRVMGIVQRAVSMQCITNSRQRLFLLHNNQKTEERGGFP